MSSVTYLREEDVSGDGGIIKKVIREGSGECPPSGSKVTVHYVGTLLDGSEFDSSRGRGDPFEFKIGKGQVIKGWDQGVATMKPGELAVLLCRSDYAYGKSGSPPKIPADATLSFEVELLHFEESEKEEWEMTAVEKVESAAKLREEGNALFRSGEVARATQKYDKAAKRLEGTYDLDEEQEKQVEGLKLPLYLNLAACHLKQGNFKETISSCNKALDLEPKNVKALFRRAQGHILAGDFAKAKTDFEAALEVSPEDKEIKLAYTKAKKQEADAKAAEKSLYKSMFGR
eukprot:TRINITY_DN6674_c0_g1_i1.p1 TRINITY_DN6674_c0_g1~~TRINITY_DN6674_c0_g1_i1.p1  ORF type:complete len:288 (-),score=95.41 TRINITY_DN6674_c0_g1_i1:38-901(-)